MIVSTTGLIALTPAVDLTNYEGYGVKYSSGNAALVSATTDKIIGIVSDGEDTAGKASIALLGGGVIAKVKLSGTVAQGAELQLAADGTFITDAGTGARAICGRALEAGVSGDLINALLSSLDPRT